MGQDLGDEVINVTDYGDLPRPNKPGKPNRRYDISRDGKLHRSRWTDSEGKPTRDRDYEHPGDGHGIGFPHDHIWDNGERMGQPIPPGDY